MEQSQLIAFALWALLKLLEAYRSPRNLSTSLNVFQLHFLKEWHLSVQFYWPVFIFIEKTLPSELLSALLMLVSPGWREKLFLFMNRAPETWKKSELFSWVQKGTNIHPHNMLFFVAALTKAGWLLKRACSSAAHSWILSALTLLCPSLLVLSSLIPNVKMPCRFHGEFSLLSVVCGWAGTSTNRVEKKSNYWYQELCLNWDHFPAPRSSACFGQTCHHCSMRPALSHAAGILFSKWCKAKPKCTGEKGAVAASTRALRGSSGRHDPGPCKQHLCQRAGA